MTETQFTKLICDDLPVVFVTTSHGPGPHSHHSGWPDRYVSHPLWHGWLEFKLHNGRLTTKQHIMLSRLREHDPGQAYVVRLGDKDGAYPSTIEDENGVVLSTLFLLVSYPGQKLMRTLHDLSR